MVLRDEIVVLRDENKGYKEQLQDGTLSKNLAKVTSNWIYTNDRLIEAKEKQIEAKEKQIEQQERQITAQIEEQEKRTTTQIKEQEKRATFDLEITLERIRNPGNSAVHRFT